MLILFLFLIPSCLGHGFITSPPPRTLALPLGVYGPKTYLPQENRSKCECYSSHQSDPGVGAQGYSYFPQGANVTLTWRITLVHMPEAKNTGVSIFWKNNSNVTDCFIDHRLDLPLLPSGQLGDHNLTITLPNEYFTNGTIMWYWNSTDRGYYFSCVDFTNAGPALGGPNMSTDANGVGWKSGPVDQRMLQSAPVSTTTGAATTTSAPATTTTTVPATTTTTAPVAPGPRTTSVGPNTTTASSSTSTGSTVNPGDMKQVKRKGKKGKNLATTGNTAGTATTGKTAGSGSTQTTSSTGSTGSTASTASAGNSTNTSTLQSDIKKKNQTMMQEANTGNMLMLRNGLGNTSMDNETMGNETMFGSEENETTTRHITPCFNSANESETSMENETISNTTTQSTTSPSGGMTTGMMGNETMENNTSMQQGMNETENDTTNTSMGQAVNSGMQNETTQTTSENTTTTTTNGNTGSMVGFNNGTGSGNNKTMNNESANETMSSSLESEIIAEAENISRTDNISLIGLLTEFLDSEGLETSMLEAELSNMTVSPSTLGSIFQMLNESLMNFLQMVNGRLQAQSLVDRYRGLASGAGVNNNASSMGTKTSQSAANKTTTNNTPMPTNGMTRQTNRTTTNTSMPPNRMTTQTNQTTINNTPPNNGMTTQTNKTTNSTSMPPNGMTSQSTTNRTNNTSMSNGSSMGPMTRQNTANQTTTSSTQPPIASSTTNNATTTNHTSTQLPIPSQSSMTPTPQQTATGIGKKLAKAKKAKKNKGSP